MTIHATTTMTDAPARSLVALLGEPRAAIVERLRREGAGTVAELATHLSISEVAIRRHLSVLEDEGLAVGRVADAGPRGRGRPPVRYELTGAAGQLYPQGYDRLAGEVLDFLADAHGREGVRAFLGWRLEREVSGLRSAVTAQDLHDRLEQLADALSEAGFDASVAPEGEGFNLTQEHCAIYDVAKDHPEICAYEAATFSKVLGRDVTLSRRQTLAGGSPACVCAITPSTTDRRAPTALDETDLPSTATSTSPEGRGDQL